MAKSLEATKATEALKRKTTAFEKLQKTAFEEKNRLREECLKSIQTIGELKSKLSLFELRFREQSEEVVILREKLSQANPKIAGYEAELVSKNAQLETLTQREER